MDLPRYTLPTQLAAYLSRLRQILTTMRPTASNSPAFTSNFTIRALGMSLCGRLDYELARKEAFPLLSTQSSPGSSRYRTCSGSMVFTTVRERRHDAARGCRDWRRASLSAEGRSENPDS